MTIRYRGSTWTYWGVAPVLAEQEASGGVVYFEPRWPELCPYCRQPVHLAVLNGSIDLERSIKLVPGRRPDLKMASIVLAPVISARYAPCTCTWRADEIWWRNDPRRQHALHRRPTPPA